MRPFHPDTTRECNRPATKFHHDRIPIARTLCDSLSLACASCYLDASKSGERASARGALRNLRAYLISTRELDVFRITKLFKHRVD